MALQPQGLTPFEAAKAWHLRQVQTFPWHRAREQVRAISGERPNMYALEHAEEQKSTIVALVKQWRRERFCPVAYIVQEFRKSCCRKTVALTLNTPFVARKALEHRDLYLHA